MYLELSSINMIVLSILLYLIPYLDWIPRKKWKNEVDVISPTVRRIASPRVPLRPSVPFLPSLPSIPSVPEAKLTKRRGTGEHARARCERVDYRLRIGHVLLLRFASTDPIGANRVVIIGNALSTFVGERLWSCSIRDRNVPSRFFFSAKARRVINKCFVIWCSIFINNGKGEYTY